MNRRIAIVTGVSRLKGIGKAICCELAKQDIDIFFTYWTNYDQKMPWGVLQEEPGLIEAEIKALGVDCHKMELNLAVPKAYEMLFEEVRNKMGDPSILVNNATYSTQTNVDTISELELDRHYAVNIKATTLLCAAFIRRFEGIQDGRIINISSGQSLSNMSDEIAYAITKGAVETLTRTLTQVAAAKGITINAVNPGLTDSGWMDDAAKEQWRSYFPMGRIGMPQDAAKLVAFLASEAAVWVTGQVIHSEGGFQRENY